MKQSEIEEGGVYANGRRQRRVFDMGTGEGMVWEKGEAFVRYAQLWDWGDPTTHPDGSETLATFASWAKERVR